jgi:hypothetical protein
MAGYELPKITCTRNEEFLYGYGGFILDQESGGKKEKKRKILFASANTP